MMDHANEFPIKKMSEVFGVSRSAYYCWQKEKDQRNSIQTAIDEQIKKVFEKSRNTYGSPRVHEELSKKGIAISKSTVARRMQELKISPRRKRKYKRTTDSKHDMPISPNLLEQNFEAEELGKKWVSDISHIRVRHHFVYLTTVIDLADRMVVGWSLSKDMTDKHTTIAALKKALKIRPVEAGLIFHSDRGSQYASKDFRALLKANKCKQSMSRKGNCYDNAVAESFFKTIKVESLYDYKFESYEQVQAVVFDYIDGWYNTQRIHSSLDGLSPSEMSQVLQQKNDIQLKEKLQQQQQQQQQQHFLNNFN